MDDFDGGLIADGLFAGCFDPGDDDLVTACPRMRDNAEALAAKVRTAQRAHIDDLFTSLCEMARNMDPKIVERALIRLAEMESKAAA